MLQGSEQVGDEDCYGCQDNRSVKTVAAITSSAIRDSLQLC